MKYLVSIESLDYARQRNLENKFQTTYVNVNEETAECFIIVEELEKAMEIENAIKALEIIDNI